MSSPSDARDSAVQSSSAIDEVYLSSQWNGPPASPAVLKPDPPPSEERAGPVRRRVWLPIFLFLLTMASTFVAGATGWIPQGYIFREDPIPFRLAILKHWDDGLLYM